MNSTFLSEAIVVDTGPLIAFAHLHWFDELGSLFNKIMITEQVFFESQVEPEREDSQGIKAAVNSGLIQIRRVTVNPDKYPVGLGVGEISSIELVVDLKCPVVLDDKQARQYAHKSGVLVIGTAGILLHGKQMHTIDLVMPLLQKLRNNQYYFSDELIKKIKQLANE